MLIRTFLRLTSKQFVYLLYSWCLLTFNFINKLPRGRISNSRVLESIWNQIYELRFDGQQIKFHVPNWLTYFRAETFFAKEPETIDWIARIPKGSVFWDIGANIGTFTICAATRKLKVVAVEPSFLNLEILNRNILTNNVSNIVTIVPFAVGNRTSSLDLFMSPNSFTWGGAHSSIGENISAGGKPILAPITVNTLCFTMEDLVKLVSLDPPTHLKIDVDGLELEVLEGGANLLSKITSILIEVDNHFYGQREKISQLLQKYGFTLDFESLTNSATTNQIWNRNR